MDPWSPVAPVPCQCNTQATTLSPRQITMRRTPRIGLVTDSMNCGGLEAVLLRLGRYLLENGFEVEIITTREPGEWFGKIGEWGLSGHHVDELSSSYPFSPIINSVRAGRTIVKQDFDVVFLNHAIHAQASMAVFAGKTAVIPVLHGDVEVVYRVGCANASLATALVGVSPKICQAARQAVNNTPVVEILNGVDMPAQAGWANRIQPSLPMRLVYVGRVDQQQKNVLLLPHIISACRRRGLDARLAVVGDGPDAARLRQECGELRVSNNVDFIGAVSPDEVYDILLNSHILVLPSFYEGLPIAVLEAQACGCVPVVTSLPGITDVAVQDQKTGILVSELTGHAFADAILELSEPSTWQEMSNASHSWASSRFSVEAMGKRYRDLVEDAMEGKYERPGPSHNLFPVSASLFPWSAQLPRPIFRMYKALTRRPRELLRTRSFL